MNVESGHLASANGAGATAQDGAPAGSSAAPGAAGGLNFIRERPELLVGAAFAGVIAAFFLRRLGH
jgi:hypothetical protein